MYIPAAFAEIRPQELTRIIREHPLGLLIRSGADGLDADHIPFLFDPTSGEHGTLTAHVARANPLWRDCSHTTEVLVVFRGEHGYISPNWYPSKHEEHQQVPTWNYEVVHAYGTLTVHDDARFLRAVVGRLTKRHEQIEAKPWKMSDAAPGVIDAFLQEIVGIEIPITRLVGKRKLSQTKSDRDRLGAAQGLAGVGNHALAHAMRTCSA